MLLPWQEGSRHVQDLSELFLQLLVSLYLFQNKKLKSFFFGLSFVPLFFISVTCRFLVVSELNECKLND